MCLGLNYTSISVPVLQAHDNRQYMALMGVGKLIVYYLKCLNLNTSYSVGL